ncbi:Shufflon-specific DNA recombinase [Chlamydiales bacterium SCGC AG-110-M15]|nr:Shufflon-specific DNA recombinase [Chlamydiales bacterium SCGC AG-110-M15]
MASINMRKTKNGVRFRVQIRLKGSPTICATFDRKTDARKWVQETEMAIREGKYFKESKSRKKTLGEAVDRYLETVLPAEDRSKRREILIWWKEKMGGMLLGDITPSVISTCRDELLRGLTRRKKQRSPATVSRYLAFLSHVFTVSINDWDWLNDTPMRRVTKPKLGRGRVRFLDEEERTSLLLMCQKSDNIHLYTIVLLALSTGMRKGELMNLKWRDVDLSDKRIILNDTKNDERRVVPLTGRALQLLMGMKKKRNSSKDLIFPSEKTPNKAIDIRSAWEKALERANIEDFRFHDLRHCTASYLAMNGASLNEIAEVLGHKTIQMSKRYAHLSQAHTEGVVERMTERFLA